MATSKLQIEVGDLLDKTLPEYRIRENYRPDWLVSSNFTKLELDFYIEELKIAIEVQGLQHYQFIPFFYKTLDDFERRKLYDKEKKDLCYGAGIRLIEIDCLMDAICIVKEISDLLYDDNEAYAIPTTDNEFIKVLKKRAQKRREQSILKKKKASGIFSMCPPNKEFEIWMRQSVKAFKQGISPNCNFVSTIPEDISKQIRARLKKARSESEIKTIFSDYL